MRMPTVDIAGKQCVTTGGLAELLGFSVGREFIEDSLKIKPFAKIKSATYWSVEDVQAICHKLAVHCSRCAQEAAR